LRRTKNSLKKNSKSLYIIKKYLRFEKKKKKKKKSKHLLKDLLGKKEKEKKVPDQVTTIFFPNQPLHGMPKSMCV
jgi:hypothetical protein